MYLAGYLVCGLHRRRRVRVRVAARAARPLPPHGAGRDAGVRVAGRAGAGDRRRLGGARRSPSASRSSSRRWRGCSARQTGAPFTLGGFYDERAARCATGSRCRGCSRCWPSTTRTRRSSGSTRCRRRTARRSTSCASRSRRWSGSAPAWRCSASCSSWTWCRKRRLPRSPWFFRAVMAAGPLSFVALIAGWITTEVGRQPWIVYEVMRTEEAVTAADGLEVGYVVLIAVYIGARRARSSGCCGGSRASRRRARWRRCWLRSARLRRPRHRRLRGARQRRLRRRLLGPDRRRRPPRRAACAG